MADELIKRELSYIRREPELSALIDAERLRDPGYARHLRSKAHFDFASEDEGGRGGSYRRAQEDILVRTTGIRQLLGLFSGRSGSAPRSPGLVLDVLGGDGLIARASRGLAGAEQWPRILTSDAAYGMVLAARSHGIPTLWQPAEHLILKDRVVDGVLLAYGTHHIARDDRQIAINEAHRVLQPGGRIVLHDFDAASATAKWFGEVVNARSRTKHPYAHFTTGEFEHLLLSAGFRDINVRPMYDPFVKRGRTAVEAVDGLADYIQNMYGLYDFNGVRDADLTKMIVLGLAFRYFHFDLPALGLPASFGREQLTISRDEQGWLAEMPRIALVATGIKP